MLIYYFYIDDYCVAYYAMLLRHDAADALRCAADAAASALLRPLIFFMPLFCRPCRLALSADFLMPCASAVLLRRLPPFDAMPLRAFTASFSRYDVDYVTPLRHASHFI